MGWAESGGYPLFCWWCLNRDDDNHGVCIEMMSLISLQASKEPTSLHRHPSWCLHKDYVTPGEVTNFPVEGECVAVFYTNILYRTG